MKLKLITKKEILPIGLILLMVATGFLLYSRLPDQVPSHWNSAGQIDDYSSKGFTVLFFPAITLLIYLLMTFLPLIDPLRKNYQKFKTPYFFIRLVLIFFFALIYFYTLAAGMGYQSNITYFIIPAIALLFVVIGYALPKVKQNWFVGIRTPWTLQSDEVWQKTHQLAGKIFIAMGILSLLTILVASELAFKLFAGMVITGSLFPIAYSYIIYRQLGLFRDKK